MKASRVGFTIIELLVIVVVIGILASVVIIGYGNWRGNIAEDQIKSDLTGAAAAMESARNFGSDYPADIPSSFTPSDGVTLTTKSGGGVFCIEAESTGAPGDIYSIRKSEEPSAGGCGAYFTSIVKRGNHTMCGITYGKVYCWGEGASGFLGNGGTANSLVPVAADTTYMVGTVSNLSPSCALSEGKAYCWGNNTAGSLGIGHGTSPVVTPTPVVTSVMTSRVTSMPGGGMFSCGIAAGKAYCWGSGSSGELGNGASVSSHVPVAVSTSVMSDEVTAIATGNTHNCAIAAGKAYCWGSGSSGQLGNGSSSSSNTPVAVNTSQMSGRVTALAISNSHTCAIADGKAYCWGAGSYSPTAHGHLGNGSTAGVNIPTAVNTSVMTGVVTSIDTRSARTCAIAAGKAYCWGDAGPMLGNGTTGTSLVPVAVNTSVMSGKVTAIDINGTTACAIADGKLYCWGNGTSGQLGNGASLTSNTPVAVSTSEMTGRVTSVQVGANFVCAIAGGKVYCWGNGANGQLGDGTTNTRNTPAMITAPL